jgi:hypothetical protein
MLYMFQAGFPPIISSSNYTHSIWYMSSLLAAILKGIYILDLRVVTVIRNATAFPENQPSATQTFRAEKQILGPPW